MMKFWLVCKRQSRRKNNDAIHTLGHDEVKDVKVGKFFDVTLDASGAKLDEAVKDIAERLLVNFNMETYTYQVMGAE